MALNGGARERFACPVRSGCFQRTSKKQADCSVPGFFFATSFEAAEHGGTAAGPKLSPMLSESSPWKGIFTRRSSADKAKPPKRGDRNASLRELALQQVLELDATAEVPTLTAIPILTRCWSRARSDAAAEAPLDDLREIASVIALWPPACLPWVLPPRSSPALCVLLRQRPAQSRLRRAPRSGHPGATSSAYELREHGAASARFRYSATRRMSGVRPRPPQARRRRRGAAARLRRRLRCTTTAACESVGSQVELHDLRSVAFNCQRGMVVGPMVEGRYPVEVVVSGAKKRIRIRLENLRSVNI